MEILSASYNLSFFLVVCTTNEFFLNCFRLLSYIANISNLRVSPASICTSWAKYCCVLCTLNMQLRYIFPTQKDLEILIKLTSYLGQKDLFHLDYANHKTFCITAKVRLPMKNNMRRGH